MTWSADGQLHSVAIATQRTSLLSLSDGAMLRSTDNARWLRSMIPWTRNDIRERWAYQPMVAGCVVSSPATLRQVNFDYSIIFVRYVRGQSLIDDDAPELPISRFDIKVGGPNSILNIKSKIKLKVFACKVVIFPSLHLISFFY